MSLAVPEKALYTLLEADSAFGALVGDRLYDGARPEADSLPAAVHDVISDTEKGPRTARATSGTRPYWARIQLSCFGTTAESAKAVAEAAITACRGQSGSIGGVTVEDITFERGPSIFDADVAIHTQSVDFMVTYLR